MLDFDYPNVNVSKKTNEENIQAIKSWGMNTSDSVKFYVAQLEARIDALESKMAKLEEENNG